MNINTRTDKRELFRWLKSASEKEIGRVFQEYLLESEHQSWEGHPYKDIRAYYRLFQDIELFRENEQRIIDSTVIHSHGERIITNK